MHILIVDDHALVRDALKTGLTRLGYQTSMAENGRKALEAMEQKRPDVLVTDINMPEMDGVELIEAARRNFPNLPIVAMSASNFGDQRTLRSLTDIDNECKLVKPFTAEELVDAIDYARTNAA